MPSRASASARLGPTPFRYLTDVVSSSGITRSRAAPPGGRARAGADPPRRRVAPLPGAPDARDAQPPRPDLELLPRPRPNRIGGGEQHAPALPAEPVRQLRDGGGLADAVHAEHEDDAGGLGCPREPSRIGVRRRGRREDPGDGLLERRLEIAIGDARHLLENLGGRRDAEIGFEQDALSLL